MEKLQKLLTAEGIKLSDEELISKLQDLGYDPAKLTEDNVKAIVQAFIANKGAIAVTNQPNGKVTKGGRKKKEAVAMPSTATSAVSGISAEIGQTLQVFGELADHASDQVCLDLQAIADSIVPDALGKFNQTMGGRTARNFRPQIHAAFAGIFHGDE